jgi:hypothetical protein
MHRTLRHRPSERALRSPFAKRYPGQLVHEICRPSAVAPPPQACEGSSTQYGDGGSHIGAHGRPPGSLAHVASCTSPGGHRPPSSAAMHAGKPPHPVQGVTQYWVAAHVRGPQANGPSAAPPSVGASCARASSVTASSLASPPPAPDGTEGLDPQATPWPRAATARIFAFIAVRPMQRESLAESCDFTDDGACQGVPFPEATPRFRAESSRGM